MMISAAVVTLDRGCTDARAAVVVSATVLVLVAVVRVRGRAPTRRAVLRDRARRVVGVAVVVVRGVVVGGVSGRRV